MKARFSRWVCLLAGLFSLIGWIGAASANDTVRVVSASRGLWTTTLVEFGERKGLFKNASLGIDIIWTDGGADAIQAIVTGSADVAVATGTLGAIAAWARGAPVTIIGADFLGGSDLFWFVRADSPIKSVKDLTDKTVGYSRPGASSQLMAQSIVEAAGVKAKLVPSGNPAASLTAVMTRQIDVGWSAPPTSFEQLQKGEIRILFSGNDDPEIAKQTVRVHVVNRNFLTSKPDVVKRFLQAYQKTIDWAYGTDEALEMWTEQRKVPIEIARQARDVGYPRDKVSLAPMHGIELTLDQAVKAKRLNQPLTAAQIADLTKYVNELKLD